MNAYNPESVMNTGMLREFDSMFLRSALNDLRPFDFLCVGFADFTDGGVRIRRAAVLEGVLHEDNEKLIGQCALLLNTWRTIGNPIVIDIGPCACLGARLLHRKSASRIVAMEGQALEAEQFIFLVVSSSSWTLSAVDKALLTQTLSELLNRARNQPETNHEQAVWQESPVNLTPREVEIVKLVAQGMTNKEIARALSLSPNTVRNHLTNLGAKTGCRRRAQLATLAMQCELAAKPPKP